VRALEVIFLSGKKFSEQRRVGQSQYSILKLGLNRPRPELYKRVDDRILAMLDQGFIEEVRALRDSGLSADLPTLSAIGYREICAYLDGQMSLEEAVTRMKRLTRDYIRRQANWFKSDDPNIHWIQAGPEALPQAISVLEKSDCWTVPGAQVQ